MSTAAFRHPREHVADLLPAFLNGSLDPDDRFVVQRHLAGCDDCMQSLAAWRAIADATRGGVAQFEQRIAGQAITLDPAVPHARHHAQPANHKEKAMNTSTLPRVAAPLTPPLRLPTRRAVSRAFQPLARLAAVIAIALSVGVGVIAFLNSGPDSGSHALAPAGASHQADACTTTALTDARIAAAVYLPGTIDGTTHDQATYIDPAVKVDDPNTLPSGSPADQATIDSVTAVWTQFQACDGANDGQALSLLTQDGLRRMYYRGIYYNIDAAFQDRQAGEAKVQARSANAAGATPTAETKPYPNGLPTDVSFTPSSPAGLVITQVELLPDGRVLAGLDNPATAGASPSELDGVAVFAKSGDGWLIDDYTVFHG